MKEEFDHQEKADAEDNDSEFEMPDISSNPDLGDDSQDPSQRNHQSMLTLMVRKRVMMELNLRVVI